MEFFNPMEIKVKMKRIENTRNGNVYYIGNANMQFDTKDTVITMYPASEGERMGTLVIKKYVPQEEGDDELPVMGKAWDTGYSPCLLLEEVILGRVNRRFGPVGDARLGVNVGQMAGNGVDADEKFFANFRVTLSCGDEAQDLNLAGS